MSNKKRILRKIDQINFKNRHWFSTFLRSIELKRYEKRKKFPVEGFIQEKGSELVTDKFGFIKQITVPADVKWNKLTLQEGKELFYVPLELLNLE